MVKLHMERRRFKRIDFNLDGELISNNKSYMVFTKNLSQNSIHLSTLLAKTSIDFNSEADLELKIKSPSGETLHLLCETLWLHSYKTPAHGLTNNMCVKIINPPSKYMEFLKTLL